MTISRTSSRAAKARSVHVSTGSPRSGWKILLTAPPKRVERPAAGRMTANWDMLGRASDISVKESFDPP